MYNKNSSCNFWIALSFLLLVFSPCFGEDPWGRDADLVNGPLVQSCVQAETSSLAARLGIAAIRFHQEVISPADGPRSHYIPSSSQYTLDSIKKYGFVTGFMLGCDRLMRENNEEWVYRKTTTPNGQLIKWDPIK